ncbi:MAG: HNH endonuclease [Bacteroidia bacterium]|jgi:hypothetical protein|nr:HNH endonuclease [Bacteroidia bacterium]
MGYTTERLEQIFDKTDGHCHLCHGKISFTQYGKNSSSGWEVEHSVPKSKGGTDNLKNLFPAHITCNRSKKDKSTKTVRSEYRHTRAPYSREVKQSIKRNNSTAGAIVGGSVGAIFDPVGILFGAIIGGAIGSANSPES